MDTEREEVYERIPWETLENKGGDRQWMVYAVAGAVTLGALAYSFTRNQPVAAPTTVVPVAVVSEAPQQPATDATVSSPIVVAEADLYAVDPERVVDEVAAHAEWFAVEYISFDGSESSAEALASLMPAGLPLPEAAEGTQVFVDWARTARVTKTGAVSYEAEVMVRSLMSQGETAFVRQPVRRLTVGVELGDDGTPRVSGVPEVFRAAPTSPPTLDLVSVPAEVVASIEPVVERVIGGIQGEDGSWEVVVLSRDDDGVSRVSIVRP